MASITRRTFIKLAGASAATLKTAEAAVPAQRGTGGVTSG